MCVCVCVCVNLCFQSSEHQEYKYLLKWKGYGEEENSWVPASCMNCWDLLQAYLSKNIYKNHSTVSLACLTPTPTNSVTSNISKVMGQSKVKVTKTKQHTSKDILVSNSTKSKGTLRLHITEPGIKKRRSVPSSLKQSLLTEKKNAQFSTPKYPPSSLKFGAQKPPKSALSSRIKSKIPHNVHGILKQRKGSSSSNGTNSPVLSSPSLSPLMSASGDDFISHSEEGSVSIDDSFRLYLDSDEDSSVSGSRSLSGESPLTLGDQSCVANSPMIQVNVCSSQQKQVNGYANAFYQHSNGMVKSAGPLTINKEEVAKRMNGLVHHLPSSTTQSNTENSSDSESWSKRRLRKRVHSSSPTSLLEYVNLESVGHAEVSSTTSPLMKNIDSGTHYTFPLTSTSLPVTTPSIEHGTASTPQLFITQRQSPSPEYQQELLEWQFMLNKQCRPNEAYILVENRMDEATIPWSFKYITSNQYGEGVPDPSKLKAEGRICGCTCYIMGKRCGPKNQHCCPKMAGADFPYSPAGKIRLPPGNPIYECNSLCSCPQDCLNRVVQRGRKINMCIFRTPNGRGWGVKTMEPIKPNTFVTEYVGEVVTTDEAERRGELYDQEGKTYLFDLDFSCDDNAFTIDAAYYGNISHFFNHSVRTTIYPWFNILTHHTPSTSQHCKIS